MSEPQDTKLAEVLERLEQVTRQSIQQPLQTRLLQHFLIGMAYSLGALMAIAILVPLILFILSNIAWVPLIGEFVEQIIGYIQNAQR